MNGSPKEQGAVLAKLELLLDSYLSVATPVQRVLPDLLYIGSSIRGKIDARLRQNRQSLGVLKNSPIEPLASEGGWSTILQLPNICSEEDWIAKLLAYDAVVVQPGYFYDMAKEAFVVVSLLTDPVVFTEGIGRLKARVGRL